MKTHRWKGRLAASIQKYLQEPAECKERLARALEVVALAKDGRMYCFSISTVWPETPHELDVERSARAELLAALQVESEAEAEAEYKGEAESEGEAEYEGEAEAESVTTSSTPYVSSTK